MDDEPTYRDKAAAKLDQIAHDAKQALVEHGIDLDLFFVALNSGEAILIYGTPADPSDVLWDEVSEIVSAIVRQSVGVERTQCRSLLCATTHIDPLS
jgi:hypothetical protein